MSESTKPRSLTLTVISAVWNDSPNVPYFYGRVRAALEQLPAVNWSIVFVNNASEDDSLEQMLRLRADDPRVKILTLSRNFGYHPALWAGLSRAESDLYALVDVDCEDPPELLVEFFQLVQHGVQIAYGVRSDRDEPWVMTLGRRLFYLLNRLVADSEMVMWMGEFAMMTRQVRDAVISPTTTFPFVRAEMGYVGFRRSGLTYRRARRRHGKSHYGLWPLTQFAIAGILSGTTFPLRLISYLSMALAVLFPLSLIALRLDLEQAARLAVITLFYYVLVSVSVIALYLARTYRNGSARPVFVIDQTQTFL